MISMSDVDYCKLSVWQPNNVCLPFLTVVCSKWLPFVRGFLNYFPNMMCLMVLLMTPDDSSLPFNYEAIANITFIHPEKTNISLYHLTSSFCQLLCLQCTYWYFKHDFRPVGGVKPVTFCLCIIIQAAAVSTVFHAICRVSKQKYFNIQQLKLVKIQYSTGWHLLKCDCWYKKH